MTNLKLINSPFCFFFLFYLTVLICGEKKLVSVCCRCVFVDTDEISVMEGDSVTLNSGLTEIMDDDLILWKLWIENTLIAELNVTAKDISVYDDHVYEIFRGRLKVDVHTGSLTITSTRFQHAGHYELLINQISIYFFLNVFRELKRHLFIS